MKKIIFTVIMMTMILTITSCGTKTNEQKNDVNDVAKEDDLIEIDIDEDLEEKEEEIQEEEEEEIQEEEEETIIESSEVNLESIINETYTATGLEFPQFAFTPLSKENQSYMLGVDNFDFIEGIVSEPMMSSQAHSFVLFTVEEGADIEKIKEDIKANVDGRKWICVSVEPENIIVGHVGNMIYLIMDEQSQSIHDALLTIIK